MTTSSNKKKIIDQTVMDGDVELLHKLLADDPELLSPRLWFPAILVGGIDMCQVLLDHGLNPNESGAERTPLHFAAEQGKVNVVEFLLANGADPNVRDSSGATPLDLACEYGADAGHPELIPILIRSGTERTFATNIRVGDVRRVCEHLELHPEELDTTPPTGIGTPLMMASRCGRTALVAELVHRGANVNALNAVEVTGTGGNSPLWFAAQGRRMGRAPLVKLLLEAGANVNEVCENGETPLHVAAAWNQAQVAYALIRAGANLEARTKKGETPLEFAIRWEFREVEAVIRAGNQPLTHFAVVDGVVAT